MGLIDFLNVLLRLNIPLFCVLMFMKGRNCHCHPGSSEISLSLGKWGAFPACGSHSFSTAARGLALSTDNSHTGKIGAQFHCVCISVLGFQTLGNHAGTLVLPWRNVPVAYLGAMSPTSFGPSSWHSSPQDRIKEGIRAGS